MGPAIAAKCGQPSIISDDDGLSKTLHQALLLPLRKLTVRGEYGHRGHFGDGFLRDIEFEVTLHFTTDLAGQIKQPGSEAP